MSKRKPIKDASESARGDRFLAWLAHEMSSNFTVTGRPEPPDILFTDGHSTSWLEIAEVFRSPVEAHEQYSHVTPGEQRHTFSPRIIQEPDKKIAREIVTVLHNKLSSDTYGSHFTRFGSGLLVLTERDPLFSESTLWVAQDCLLSVPISVDRGHFKRAFLDFSMNGVFDYREIYPTPALHSRTT